SRFVSLSARATSTPVLGSSHAVSRVRPGELSATVSAGEARDAGLDGVRDSDRAGVAHQDVAALAHIGEAQGRGYGYQRWGGGRAVLDPVSRPRRELAGGGLPSLRLDLRPPRRLRGLPGRRGLRPLPVRGTRGCR